MAYLHSIFLTGGTAPATPLPPRLEANVRSFREQHPAFAHTLFDDEMLREFIKANVGKDAVQAFDTLLPLAYKADLGRYCLLHELGGIYADMSVHFFRPLLNDLNPNRLHLFRDTFSQAPWIVSNSIIGVPARERVFQLCVERIIEHCRSRYYGVNPLCPTGPNLFGQMVATAVPLERLVCGDTVRINRTAAHSHAYLMPDGEVSAVNIKTGPGLASLGARIDEDYNRHHAARNAYGELGAPLRWSGVECLQLGCIDTPDTGSPRGPWRVQAGLVLRTPGVALGAGVYSTRITFRSLKPVNEEIDLHLEVACDAGRRVLAQSGPIRVAQHRGEHWYGARFRLDQTARDVELRVRLSGAALMELLGVRFLNDGATPTSVPVSPSAL